MRNDLIESGRRRTLLLCAIQDWIAISRPSAPDWELDTLNVTFRELLSDDEWRGAQQTIENLACASHAAQISDRYRARILSDLTPGQQWEQRETVFPHLLFGLDVDDKVKESGQLTAILSRSLSEKQCSKRYASLVECKDANYSTTKSRLL